MDEQIMAHFLPITQEEQCILNGQDCIDRELYMLGNPDVINSRKLLSAGKMIALRPNTRFVHFPKHTHDYVEMVYMCAGNTVHIVNGQRLELHAGELLLLNQSATHEVLPARQTDVAVNFIILPGFFSTALLDLGEEETPLRRFLVDCLCGKNMAPDYLHFRVSNIKPVQNLVENLLLLLLQDRWNGRKLSRMTMSLLLLQLVEHTETLSVPNQEAAILKVLQYAESNYTSGSLTDAARTLHYDLAWLSREVKRRTGKTYTQIIQEKRLTHAAFLLRNTSRNVSDISAAVGYENVSYFHRIFRMTFGCSPKHFRDGR